MIFFGVFGDKDTFFGDEIIFSWHNDSIFATFKILSFCTCIEQQWAFQSRKHAWLKDQKSTSKYTAEEIEDFKRGFLVKGLFGYCRHPNYFGDIFLWWCIYLFTVTSQVQEFSKQFHIGAFFNYSMFSALLMTLLFKRSVQVTEKIAANKYGQAYAHYKANVGRIVPKSLQAYIPQKNKSS